MLIIGASAGTILTAAVAAARLRALRRVLASARDDTAAARDAEMAVRQQAADTERTLLSSHAEVKAELARVSAELEKEREHVQDKMRLLEETRAGIDARLKALCSEALSSSSQQLVALASQQLSTERSESRREIEGDRHRLVEVMRPISASLGRFEHRLGQLEQERQRGRVELHAQLSSLSEAQARLLAGTDALVGAFRRPEVRGEWGELTLRRVVEDAGMLPHVHFTEQPTVEGPDGVLRPDLLVHMPGGKDVIVDSKVPLQAYLDATAATDEAERRRLMQLHARQLRQHLRSLESKAYWAQFTSTPEIVFAFVPNDAVLDAALRADKRLLGELAGRRVVVAGPISLIVLMRVVAFGWRQERIADGAEEIWRTGRDLHARLGTFAEHLNMLGRRLSSAVTAFDKTAGSFQSRVLPATTRLQELGVVAESEDIDAPCEIGELPRILGKEKTDVGDDPEP
jgi:DNA recombination protein RmuC